jgi:hypothetical protein
MSSVSLILVHPEEQCEVPAAEAITKCTLFQKNPSLADSPYSLRSQVSLPIFRQFVSVIEGNAVEITAANIAGLSRLCREFGFDEIFGIPSSAISEPREVGS